MGENWSGMRSAPVIGVEPPVIGVEPAPVIGVEPSLRSAPVIGVEPDGGRRGDRTPDLCIANAALSQLS